MLNEKVEHPITVVFMDVSRNDNGVLVGVFSGNKYRFDISSCVDVEVSQLTSVTIYMVDASYFVVRYQSI